MKKFLYAFLIVLFAGVIFGFNYLKRRKEEIRIYPLSPYADSIKFTKDEDVSRERRNGIQIRFFLFDNDADYSPMSKDKMDVYIVKYLRKELKEHKAIYFTFYKSTTLDQDGRYTLNDLNKTHLADKYAEYEYINGKLFNFDFYKDGEYYEPPPTADPNN